MENNNERIDIGTLYMEQLENTDECKLGLELFLDKDKFTTNELKKIEKYLALINEVICKKFQ